MSYTNNMNIDKTGLILIIIGLLAIFGFLAKVSEFIFSLSWPIIVIIIGLVLILKKYKK